MIHNKEMGLPDFQRDFVWDPYATAELLESIIQNFPAGSLLKIKNGAEFLFEPRAFKGAPALDRNSKPSYLILDGQQRLTSLYQALYGEGDHLYYLNLAALQNGGDLEDYAFYLPRREGKSKYGTIAEQAKELIFPLGNTFSNGGFSFWISQVLRERGKDVSEILTLQAELMKLHERWIKPIEDYEFPMVTLDENTPGEAVCTIFETLNRTGVKLGVFDLLTARFWPKDLKLRQKWDEAKHEHSIIEEYDIDPYYILQIINLLEPGTDKEGKKKAPSIKRSDIISMRVEQAQRGWDRAVSALTNILGILRVDCGILIPSLIPYNTMIIPFAAVWSSVENEKGFLIGASRLKLIRWFWCTALGARYENAPNSQAAKDFVELIRWITGGDKPESVLNFDASKINLYAIGPKQRAVYRAIMAIVLNNGAMDFYNRGKITSQLIFDRANPIDDHHIFPQAFLNEKKVSPDLRDCVLNRTYIDRLTNRSLKRRAPSDYFIELRKDHGIREADLLLDSHFMPAGDDSPLFRDDYDSFLTLRGHALSEKIKQITMGD
jgi:hypothetical protein